ncbi:MAG: HAD family phosphatase [Deltaproteobacteria bacterium]|nr:HAD family phosphatase [Deltaproteobacteria bacterium]
MSVSTLARGMLVTDLDGTLKPSAGGFRPVDIEALQRLMSEGVITAIATGRSLFSYTRDITHPLPVDYIIFSSGAGILRTSDWKILRAVQLEPEQAEAAISLLLDYHLDFMVQQPIPEEHRFFFHATGNPNPDFERRLASYRDHAEPMGSMKENALAATQLVAIIPETEGVFVYERLKRNLSGLTVIRTTSPLDHSSTWVEIFPANASKSQAAQWLAHGRELSPQDVLCVGNDFNDLDMLEWAGTSYVVANSPGELRERFPEVASNNDGGVAEAIRLWLSQREGSANLPP